MQGSHTGASSSNRAAHASTAGVHAVLMDFGSTATARTTIHNRLEALAAQEDADVNACLPSRTLQYLHPVNQLSSVKLDTLK